MAAARRIARRRAVKVIRKPGERDIVVRDEATEQRTIIRWARSMGGRWDGALANLYACPNGGGRDPREGASLKAQGVSPGVPDLVLAWPASGFHGAYLELKRADGGRVSPSQRAWLDRLARAGYATTVAEGSDRAIAWLSAYLDDRLTNDAEDVAA